MKINKLSDMIPDLEAGMTNKQIAKKYRKSVPTIAKWVRTLKDAGIEIPPRKKGKRKMAI